MFLTRLNLNSIVLFILFSLSISCAHSNYDTKVNDLVQDANELITQEAKVTRELRDEFVSVFTVENREKFPGNRDKLRPHAENQIRLLKEQKTLISAAVEKFERASAMAVNDKEKLYATLVADSLRKDIDIANSFIETMNMVLDEKVADPQTLKNKFVENGERSQVKANERDALQEEARKILGKNKL